MMGSCLIVGSAYYKNTNTKVELANGVISDTLRAFANGRKEDWDGHLPKAVFTVNDAAPTLGGSLTPFFIDRGAHLACLCRRLATTHLLPRPQPEPTTHSTCGRWR